MNSRHPSILCSVVIGLCSFNAVSQAEGYTIEAIPIPAGIVLNERLNDQGKVIFDTLSGDCSNWPVLSHCYHRAFLWTDGQMVDLGNFGTDSSGSVYTYASSINATGQVAGASEYFDNNGLHKGPRAFLWSNGQMINLGTFGTDSTGWGESGAIPRRGQYTPISINATGQVAGTSTYYDDNGMDKGPRAFLWFNGQMINLGTFGTDSTGWGDSQALSINDAGQVVGVSNYYDDNGMDKGPRAFLWSNGQMINLGILGTDSTGFGGSQADIINAAGQVAGNIDYFENGIYKGLRAFLWSNGQMINLGTLGTGSTRGGHSYDKDVNAAGQVVGSSDEFDDNGLYTGWRAVISNNGAPFQAIPVLGECPTDHGKFNVALDINDRGQVVGSSNTSSCTAHAFLYQNGVVTDLNDMLPASSGWELKGAVAINEAGQILVSGTYNGILSVALLTPSNTTPVPIGSQVTAQPVDATTGTTPVLLTFETVTQAGTVSLETTTVALPPPPSFKLGEPPVYYEISTNAQFSGNVEVCITYNPTSFNDGAQLRLFHLENNQWVDRTSSHSVATNTLCAGVTSFSPFAIFERSYSFSGFFQPVDNVPVVNRVKAGQAIPLKFSLGGDYGLNILAAESPSSLNVSCTTGVIDDIEQTVTASSSSLSYSAGQYTYLWKTDKAWAVTCRQLIVKLNDGSAHVAYFQFK